MKTIIITGTPGTGKTTMAKSLAKRLNFLYLDVSRLILKHKLSEGYDKKRRTKIVDIKKLNKCLVHEINSIKTGIKKYKGIIIDSHLSHYLPKRYVNLCIVAKCDIKELGRRLRKKGFHKEKIKENIQAEIFDVCHNEALERGHKVIVADTTKVFNIRDIAKKFK